MLRERLNIYLACEEWDFTWDIREIAAFEQAWNDGFALPDIARALGRNVNEVAMLAMDRREKRQIKSRPGGIWGRCMPEGYQWSV